MGTTNRILAAGAAESPTEETRIGVSLSAQEADEIGMEAYVYLYPLDARAVGAQAGEGDPAGA